MISCRHNIMSLWYNILIWYRVVRISSRQEISCCYDIVPLWYCAAMISCRDNIILLMIYLVITIACQLIIVYRKLAVFRWIWKFIDVLNFTKFEMSEILLLDYCLVYNLSIVCFINYKKIWQDQPSLNVDSKTISSFTIILFLLSII